MPPRTITSPKKKRSKCKGSDASKAGLPKKTRAADVAEVPGAVPLVSLGLIAAEVGDNAPRRSGHPNAGTGGRTMSLGPDIPVNPQAPEPCRKGRKKSSKEVPPPYSSHLDTHPDVPAMDIIHTGPSFTSQQPGGRFRFATPSTTEIAHSDTTELNLQASNDPYVAIRTKVVEQRAPDAIAEQRARDTIAEQRARDTIAEQNTVAVQRARDAIAERHAQNVVPESPVLPRSVFLEQNLDPALCQEDDAVRAQYRLRLLGSEEHSDSKGSSRSDDSDDSNNEDANEEDDVKDEEEGDNNDTVKGSQDFDWGEVGRCQKEHPGFLEDALPSQPAVARALTPEFEFQYSRDEDDVIAQTSLDKTSRNKSSKGLPDGSPGLQGQRSQHMETITSKPDNILQCHHKKNGKPRLPEPESLKLLDQVTESSVQPSKNKKSRSSHGGPMPNQLSWYRLRWKSFLEDAKAECRVQHALENPFPTLGKNLPGTITEVLGAVLVVWDTNGKQFEAGKGLARAKIQYDSVVPVQEHAAWIEHAAAELIKGSFFLRFGVDEQGRTRNFAHPALRETVISFFYTGPYQIARRMPEIFRMELPLSCLALVAAAFNCVLNGLAKNGHGKSYPNFSMKDYGPIYCQMLELLKCILKDAYHGPRLLAQLQEWAAAGWQGS
ncbi:uncharacterized protein F5891DRAFT_1189443 [Suillus fuscotomentosus]|uniref:DUF6532 domain-containing protein n=1 Tax=Suillus fuscotomentosus TaxID=1912939 RepID=A0AAD4E4L4_9AGAM|nr:uncharacterized protein F5891DRAFT_1189443 [Suillus fuscotomentosus]KAG1899634.1 hypothetical protein F5891DRAFT_1189443 [Suillus fuscotomentosus]